jgi:uncharacterized protein YceK
MKIALSLAVVLILLSGCVASRTVNSETQCRKYKLYIPFPVGFEKCPEEKK